MSQLVLLCGLIGMLMVVLLHDGPAPQSRGSEVAACTDEGTSDSYAIGPGAVIASPSEEQCNQRREQDRGQENEDRAKHDAAANLLGGMSTRSANG